MQRRRLGKIGATAIELTLDDLREIDRASSELTIQGLRGWNA